MKAVDALLFGLVRCGLVLLAFLLSSGCGGGDQQETRAETRATISGQVVLSSLSGLDDMSRVRVDIGAGEGGITPDEDGEFLFSDIEPDVYRLRVTYQGGLSSESSDSAYRPYEVTVAVPEGGSSNLGRILLELGTGTVSGTVSLSNGASSDGAVVELHGADTVRQARVVDGDYTFSDVPVGHYTVQVERTGYKRDATSQVDCAGDVVTVDFDGDEAEAPSISLVPAVATLTPGQNQTHDVVGSVWYLAGDEVTIDIGAEFADRGRVWLDGDEVPEYRDLDSSTFGFSGLPEGATLAFVQLSDPCGDELEPEQLSLIRDDTAPVVELLQLNNGQAVTRSRTVAMTLFVHDELSDADDLEMRYVVCDVDESDVFDCDTDMDDAIWHPYTVSTSVTFSDQLGTKGVQVQIQDPSGNVTDAEAAIAYVDLDNQPPQNMVISIEDPVTGEVNGVIHTVNPIITFAGEGATEMRFGSESGLANLGWDAFDAHPSYEFALPDGEKHLYAQFRDDAGNETEEIQATVILDTAATLTGRIELAGAVDHSGIEVQLLSTNLFTTTGADGLFVLAGIPPDDYSLTAGREGYIEQRRSIRLEANDELDVGVITLLEQDTTPPENMAVVIGDGSGIITDSSPLLTVTGEGATWMKVGTTSGLANAIWQPFVETFRWDFAPGDGPKTLYLRFRDDVGNETDEIEATVTLRTTATLTGTIELAGASDHSGVEVSLLGTNLSTTTLADGSFTLSDIPADTYNVALTSTGYIEHRQSITLSVNDAVDLGVVTLLEQDTTPPQNMAVVIGDGSGIITDPSPLVTVTGEGATWMKVGTTSGLANAIWQPFVETFRWDFALGDGIKRLYLRFKDDVGNETEEIEATVTLETTATLTGRFQLADANDHSGTQVALLGTSLSTTTAADGGFVLSNIPAATYNLVAIHAGYIESRQSVTLSVNDTLDLGATTLLEQDTTPPQNVAVLIGDGSGVITDPSPLVTVTADGATEMRIGTSSGLADATWQPFVETFRWDFPAGDGIKRLFVKLRDDVGNETGEIMVEVTLNTKGTLTGVVLLPGEVDHAGIEVRLLGTAFSTSTAADGSWTIEDVPSGNYNLEATMAGYRTHRENGIYVAPVTPTDLGEILLDDYAARIIGEVTLQGWENALNHNGAEVVLTGTELSTQTDASGSFTLLASPINYPDGLTISKPGYVTYVRTDAVFLTPESTFNIGSVYLEASHNDIFGRALLADGTDHAGIQVQIVGETGSSAEGVMEQTVTDAQGDFSFSLLPLGEYRIICSYPSEPDRETASFGGIAISPGPATILDDIVLRERYVVIDEGAAATSSTSVTLTIGATDCYQMRIGNQPDLTTEPWVPCSETTAWVLSDLTDPNDRDGEVKSVYAQFTTNAAPQTPTDVVSDEIILDPLAVIDSFTHNAAGRDLDLGDTVHFWAATGEPGGVATVAIAGYEDAIRLYDDGSHGDTTAGDGTYEAEYQVSRVDDVEDAQVTVYFTDANGTSNFAHAADPITVRVPPLVHDLLVEPSHAGGTVSLSWITDEMSTAVVEWGESTAYGQQVVLDTAATAHSASFGAGSLTPGIEYHFRIVSTDPNGNSSQTQDYVVKLTPNVPTYVGAIPGDGRVWVRWEASTTVNIQGYNIYRSTMAGGPYTKLNTEPCGPASAEPACNAEALFWRDDTVTNGTEYFYVVDSVDALNQTSEQSDEEAATPGASSGPTEIEGVLTGKTVWSESHSPYIVRGTVSIEDSATESAALVIGPNVEVRFDPGFRILLIGARFVALGERGTVTGETESDDGMVVLTSNAATPAAGDWNGVFFDHTDISPPGILDVENGIYYAGNLVYRTRIGYAGGNGDGVSVYDSDVAVLRSEFHDYGYPYSSGISNGVYAEGRSAIVLDSIFSGPGRLRGVYGAGANLLVERSEFYDVDPGVDSTAGGTPRVQVRECDFERSGLMVYTSGSVIYNSRFTDAWTDTSSTRIVHCDYSGSGGASLMGGNLIVSSTFAPFNANSMGGDEVYGCTGDGLPATSSGVYFWGCTIESSQFAGTLLPHTGGTDGPPFLVFESASVLTNNTFLFDGSEYVIVSTTTDYTGAGVDAQDNYWGPDATAEMDAGGNPKDISVIYDHYDNGDLATVDYSNWASAAFPLPRVDSPRWGKQFPETATVTLVGSATAPSGGDVAGLEWFDDSGQYLGAGDTLDLNGLGVGIHRFWLHAYNSTGQDARVPTEVEIVAE